MLVARSARECPLGARWWFGYGGRFPARPVAWGPSACSGGVAFSVSGCRGADRSTPSLRTLHHLRARGTHTQRTACLNCPPTLGRWLCRSLRSRMPVGCSLGARWVLVDVAATFGLRVTACRVAGEGLRWFVRGRLGRYYVARLLVVRGSFGRQCPPPRFSLSPFRCAACALRSPLSLLLAVPLLPSCAFTRNSSLRGGGYGAQ